MNTKYLEFFNNLQNIKNYKILRELDQNISQPVVNSNSTIQGTQNTETSAPTAHDYTVVPNDIPRDYSFEYINRALLNFNVILSLINKNKIFNDFRILAKFKAGSELTLAPDTKNLIKFAQDNSENFANNSYQNIIKGALKSIDFKQKKNVFQKSIFIKNGEVYLLAFLLNFQNELSTSVIPFKTSTATLDYLSNYRGEISPTAALKLIPNFKIIGGSSSNSVIDAILKNPEPELSNISNDAAINAFNRIKEQILNSNKAENAEDKESNNPGGITQPQAEAAAALIIKNFNKILEKDSKYIDVIKEKNMSIKLSYLTVRALNPGEGTSMKVQEGNEVGIGSNVAEMFFRLSFIPAKDSNSINFKDESSILTLNDALLLAKYTSNALINTLNPKVKSKKFKDGGILYKIQYFPTDYLQKSSDTAVDFSIGFSIISKKNNALYGAAYALSGMEIPDYKRPVTMR